MTASVSRAEFRSGEGPWQVYLEVEVCRDGIGDNADASDFPPDLIAALHAWSAPDVSPVAAPPPRPTATGEHQT